MFLQVIGPKFGENFNKSLHLTPLLQLLLVNPIPANNLHTHIIDPTGRTSIVLQVSQNNTVTVLSRFPP